MPTSTCRAAGRGDTFPLIHMSICSRWFSTGFLYEELLRDCVAADSSHDFGRDIIPSIIHRSRVMAYPFRDPLTGFDFVHIGLIAAVAALALAPGGRSADSPWPASLWSAGRW